MAAAIEKGAGFKEADQNAIESGITRAEHPFSHPVGDAVSIRERLWEDMWNLTGIIRQKDELERAKKCIESHQQSLFSLGVADGNARKSVG